MSGAYIQCGEFSGSDKSGSSIYEVFDDISASLNSNNQSEWNKIRQQIERDDEDNIMFRISKSVGSDLIPFIGNYIERMGKTYLEKHREFTDPFDAVIKDYEQNSGQKDFDSKNHALNKYICAEDLLNACQHCIETGEDVIIYHDYSP